MFTINFSYEEAKKALSEEIKKLESSGEFSGNSTVLNEYRELKRQKENLEKNYEYLVETLNEVLIFS